MESIHGRSSVCRMHEQDSAEQGVRKEDEGTYRELPSNYEAGIRCVSAHQAERAKDSRFYMELGAWSRFIGPSRSAGSIETCDSRSTVCSTCSAQIIGRSEVRRSFRIYVTD